MVVWQVYVRRVKYFTYLCSMITSLGNKGFNTTQGSIYLVAIDAPPQAVAGSRDNSRTLPRLEVQFVPQSIKDNRDVDLGVMKIVGRNDPRYQIISGETTITLSLDFLADETSRKSVYAKVNWLKSLTYTDRGQKTASRVKLVWGSVDGMYANHVWTIAGINVDFSNFDKPSGYWATQATVDLTLKLDTETNWGWSDLLPDNVLQFGQSDGNNPIKFAEAYEDEQDDEWLQITNENTFNNILKRALSNLRFSPFR